MRFIIFLMFFVSVTCTAQVTDTIKGLKNGPFELKHPNGSPYLKGTFVAGQRHGKWEIHDREDIVCNYNNGVLNGEYNASENGALIKKWNYVNGKRNGIQTDYYTGSITTQHMVYEMKNDMLTGTYKKYDGEGNVEEDAVYLNGKRNGKAVYFLSGKKKNEINYKNGIPEGSYLGYDYKGNLEEQGQMAAGKRDGKWTIFENGKIEREVIYKNGAIISNSNQKKEEGN